MPMKPNTLFAAALAALLAISGMVRAQPIMPPPEITATDIETYANPADLVKLPDGRTIHLVCMGTGGPTVILNGGSGNWSADWSNIQPAVADKTRVCAWDRAGWGLSGPSPLPQTAWHTTDDLRAALTARGITGPYVLVGASLGGPDSLLFADRWRSEVAGMVFVDSSIPGQFYARARVGLGVDPYSLNNVATYEKCAADLRSTGHPATDGSCPPGSPFDRFLRVPAIVKQIAITPERYDTIASLYRNAAGSQEMAVNPARNYGDMPLIVLSAGNRLYNLPRDTPEAVKNQQDAFEAEIDRGHAALAALSTRGTLRAVPDSSHFMTIDDPQVVIDAILEVVETVRAGS